MIYDYALQKPFYNENSELEKMIYNHLIELNKQAFDQVKKEMFSLSDRYVTRIELLNMFKIGAKQLDEWKEDGLKSVKIGKKVCFDLHDVNEIIQKNKK